MIKYSVISATVAAMVSFGIITVNNMEPAKEQTVCNTGEVYAGYGAGMKRIEVTTCRIL